MFNPEGSKTRAVDNNFKIRTLLGCSDGVTSVIICDAYS